MAKIAMDSSDMAYRIPVAGVVVECATADEAIALVHLLADDDREETEAERPTT